MPAKKASVETTIIKMEEGRATVHIKGTRPLITHPFLRKAMQDLLFPSPKSRGSKLNSLKHDPLLEYRGCTYRVNEGDTMLAFPATGFKSALGTAALEIDGLKKTSVQRCIRIIGGAQNGDMVAVYGVPQMHMAMVRSADINKTPDVRTRCIFPEWAATFTVKYAKPNFTTDNIKSLIACAGMLCGIGDDRVEKGHGGFGSFEIVNGTDKDYQRIVKGGKKKEQMAALDNPDFYDDMTRELYEWVEVEFGKRGPKAV